MTGIRAAADARAAETPWGMEVALVFDQSRYTAERLAEVGWNMARAWRSSSASCSSRWAGGRR
jgi:hypothetical protein